MNVTMKRCVAALGILAIASSVAARTAGERGTEVAGLDRLLDGVAGRRVGVRARAGERPDRVHHAVARATRWTSRRSTAGKIVSTQRIDASGAERPVDAKGCTGVQRATWSADERRIYLRSASTCDGLKSTTSAILADDVVR